MVRAVALVISAAAALPAVSQTNRPTGTGSVVGVLQQPIVYYGTRIIGNAPAEKFPKDPDRFVGPGLPTILRGEGCRPGTTVIVLGSSPCYAPYWYTGTDPWMLGPNPWSYFGFQPGSSPWTPVLAAQNSLSARPLVVIFNINIQNGLPQAPVNPINLPVQREPDFGQNRNIDADLQAAVNDVVYAFRQRDTERFSRRIDRQGNIFVGAQQAGRRAVPAVVFQQMSVSGISAVKTHEFSLDAVRLGSYGQYTASGRHVLRTEDGRLAAFEVSYTFQRRTGGWRIVESLAKPIL